MGRAEAQGLWTGAGLAFLIASGCASAVGPAAPVTIASPGSPEAAPVVVVEAGVAEAGAVETGAAEAAAPGVSAGDDFSAYLTGLRRASCPGGQQDARGEKLDLAVRPITLGRLGVARQTAGLLRYAGGFALESSDARFGGLSGLEVLDDGGLLAVSDEGDVVWIDLAEDALTPTGARIAGMLDEAGDPLRGKADGDAEGLAWRDGVALVSFERNHRILAFDIGACGAAARGAAVVREGYGEALNAAFARAGLDVGANTGPEPLAVTADWYLFVGTETMSGGRGPLSARPVEAAAEYDLLVEDGAPAFVGADVLDEEDRVRAFTLHRGFGSLTGNAIVISETVFERYLDQSGLPARIVSEIDERSHYRFRAVSTRRLAELGAALNNVDNFEGIAVARREGGGLRLYVVSDDNFSERQRTMLMAFDLDE